MQVSQGQSEKRKVIFKVIAPTAKQVRLVGDFNGWDVHAHPMNKDEEGLWKVTVALSPGRYEYKLIVDGRWWEDIADANSIRNPFGTLNRVLLVPEI